ncbi:hypothetical protein ACKWTF_016513 [Chironomus riparius]
MKNKQNFLLIFFSFCGVNSEVVGSKAPIVETTNGWIVGKTFKTTNLKEFDGFLGIPFAKPPVGNLRLRDPEPYTETFTEHNPYFATEEKAHCMQKNYLLPNPSVTGVEDCLYLYVYRPKCKLSVRKCQRPLPVIVYIHGGAFFAGAAGPSLIGADYFMDTEDVIFVTMSYRLGPLGFLSTGDDNMSGNFGLKDQTLAMKWVKENIENFGGDPNNISLMGQSAGASSVHLHMMSNLSKNLFNKAIILSGNGNGPYAYVLKNPLKQAIDFAKAAGIKKAQGMSNNALSEELRKVDATKLLDASDTFKIWSIDPLVISKPVVEDCRAVEGFLCDNPVKMWKNGNYSRIPFITGIMNGDGGVRALSYFSNATLIQDLNKNFKDLFPKLLEINDIESERITTERLQMVADRYLSGRMELNKEDMKNLVHIYTDRSFLAPMANTLLQMVENESKGLGYLYKFSYKGSLSYAGFYAGDFSFKYDDPVHCDELIYLIKSPAIFGNHQEFETGSRDADFRKKLVKFFTNFASFGKPIKINGKSLYRCTKNDEFNHGSKQLRCNYVDFDDKISIKFDDPIDHNAVDFWNQLDNTLMV